MQLFWLIPMAAGLFATATLGVGAQESRAEEIIESISRTESLSLFDRDLIGRALGSVELDPDNAALAAMLLRDCSEATERVLATALEDLKKAESSDRPCESERVIEDAARRVRALSDDTWLSVVSLSPDVEAAKRLARESKRKRFLVPAGTSWTQWPGGIDLVQFCREDGLVGGLLSEIDETAMEIRRVLDEFAVTMDEAIDRTEAERIAEPRRFCEARQRGSTETLEREAARSSRVHIPTEVVADRYAAQVAELIAGARGAEQSLLFRDRYVRASMGAFFGEQSPAERKLCQCLTPRSPQKGDEVDHVAVRRRAGALAYVATRVRVGESLRSKMHRYLSQGRAWQGSRRDAEAAAEIASLRDDLDVSLRRCYRDAFGESLDGAIGRGAAWPMVLDPEAPPSEGSAIP